MSHTIVLVQPTPSKASRTFSDYESVVQALDGVCGMFEKRLKELNPQMRQITYDINDLYRYLDTLHDLSALVFAPGACLPASGWPRWGGGCQPAARGARLMASHAHARNASQLAGRFSPTATLHGLGSWWAVSWLCGQLPGGTHGDSLLALRWLLPLRTLTPACPVLPSQHKAPTCLTGRTGSSSSASHT